MIRLTEILWASFSAGRAVSQPSLPNSSEAFLNPVLPVPGSIPDSLWSDLCTVHSRHLRAL